MLRPEDRVLVAPPDHPLAQVDPLTLADLGAHPLLLEPVGTSFRDELDAEAAAAGVTLIPQAEVDGMRLLASLAHEGYGAAVLPFTAVASWREGEWTVAGVDGLSPRSVGLARRRRGLLSAPARAGSAVLHNGLTAHGAGANMTPRPRRAMTCAYMPDGSTFNGRRNILPPELFESYTVGDVLNSEWNPLIWKR